VFEGGPYGVERERLADAGRSDEHGNSMGVGADGVESGDLVGTERRAIAQRMLESGLRERLVGRGCGDGSQEAALDVEQLAAGPPRRFPHWRRRRHDVVGGEHRVGDPFNRLDGRAGSLASRNDPDQVSLGERRRGRGEAGAQSVADPFVRLQQPLDMLGSTVLVEDNVVEPPTRFDRVAGALL
jgi:hypothetical protein